MDEKTWFTKVMEEVARTSAEDDQEVCKKLTIYRVPNHIREGNMKAYEPQVVSIGPYHYGKEHLESMEVHKYRSLRYFLRRTGKHMEDYVKVLEVVVQQLKDSYERLDQMWEDKDRFLQLMILDGCFLLEFAGNFTGIFNDNPYDPIFSQHGRVTHYVHILRDVLLLENQLPHLVLEKLVTTCGESSYQRLSNFLFAPKMGSNLHMLDMYMKYMSEKSRPEQSIFQIINRSATELHDAGVEFCESKTSSIKDITFHNGILNLPILIITSNAMSMFLNFMAFERLHSVSGKDLLYYISFMNNLIRSVKDVSLLRSKGIIMDGLGNDEAILKLFKELTKDTVLVDPYASPSEVLCELNSYYEKNMKKWHKRFREWGRNLNQTYFKNPWTSISVIAAAFLLGLTAAQTTYALLSYYAS